MAVQDQSAEDGVLPGKAQRDRTGPGTSSPITPGSMPPAPVPAPAGRVAAPAAPAAQVSGQDLRPPGPRERLDATDRRHLAIGVAVGLTVAALTAVARIDGLVRGRPALALLVVLALALPTSRSLSRRILLTGALGLGWVPMLWWWPLPVGELGRAGLLLAATAGLLGGWVTGGPHPAQRLRRLLPRLRIVDLFPLLAGAVSAWMLSAWIQVRGGVAALSLMLPGWDNSVHAFITTMIRLHGTTMENLPKAPDGSLWAAHEYPQAFHAICATLIELMASPRIGTPSQETAGFARATGLVMVVVVTMMVAGICALPRLRRRPGLALPAASLVTAGFLAGPGIGALDNGQMNFVLGTALVGVAALIAWPMARPVLPLHLAALGGALVGVAHNWALLLVMAAPTALAPLLPLRRRRWQASRTAWLLGVAVVLATAYGILRAAELLAQVPSGTAMLSYSGGIVIPQLGMVLAIAFAAAATCLAAVRVLPGRAPALALVPVGGLATMAAVAVQQLQVKPTVQYYFWKLAIGVELATLVLLAAAAATMIAANARSATGRRPPRPRWVAAIAAVVVATGMTQLFGYTGPGTAEVGISAVSLGQARHEAWHQRAARPLAVADLLFGSLHVQAEHPDVNVTYLSFTTRDRILSSNADQWYWTLARTWTVRTNATAALVGRINTLDELSQAATTVLTTDERNAVMVPPDLLAPLRARLAPDLRGRILTW
jgi:hypothetical protein